VQKKNKQKPGDLLQVPLFFWREKPGFQLEDIKKSEKFIGYSWGVAPPGGKTSDNCNQLFIKRNFSLD